MSKRNRLLAASVLSVSASAVTLGDESTEGGGGDGGIEESHGAPSLPPEDEEDRAYVPETPAQRELRQLLGATALGIERSSAVFLMAYIRSSAVENSEAGLTLQSHQLLLHFVTLLHGQPMIWSAVRRADVVHFLRACDLCGLPKATVQEMQDLMAAVERDLREAPPELAETRA